MTLHSIEKRGADLLLRGDGVYETFYATSSGFWVSKASRAVKEVTPADLGMVNNTVRIPSLEGVQYLKEGVTVANGSVHEIVTRTTFTAVPRAGYGFPVDDYTWTFEPSPSSSSDFKFPFPRNLRNDPYRNHSGIDWAGGRVGNAAPIKAIGPGTVIEVYNNGANTWGQSGGSDEPVWRGRCVVVNHGSIGGRTIWSLYAHMASLSVVQGQTVAGGQQIGVIGNTGYSSGTHLHFEVIYNGQRLNTSVGGGYERTLGWLDANADGSW